MLASQVAAAGEALTVASNFERLGIVAVLGLLLAWQIWENRSLRISFVGLTERFADVAEATRDRLDRIERKAKLD